ncbi:MAG: HD domain-containing protein [Candidatus Latescibacterota bacterium]|nr:MAG: HD domain-containing protein [Candidatus Latescibacterota bacterium]
MAKKKTDSRRGTNQNIIDFILEAGALKRTPRSGWSVLGIKHPESVADHSFRCGVIGYLLAHMEKVDVHRVLLMTLFNDIHEARITDLHKMAQRYIDARPAEDASFTEQVEALPTAMRRELSGIREDYADQTSRESIVARDSDILECLIQAKEYVEHGHKSAALFMTKAPKHLTTKSAKSLWRLAKTMDVNEWWARLGSFSR